MPLYVRMMLFTGSPDEIAAVADEHRRRLNELRAQGRLRAAGKFTQGDGLFEIFEAKDLHAADAIARSSPFVRLGLGSWTLREWTEIES